MILSRVCKLVGVCAVITLAERPGELVGQEPRAQLQGSRALAVEGASAPAALLLAVPLGDEQIRLDGRVDEAVWSRAPIATDFLQFEPDEGQRASQRTEARVLYGDDALYVSLRAFDTAPDSIVGQLTRRDQSSYSDELGVIVDSYFDRRTAFHFSVNPVGVKKDVFRFEDVREDLGWDAVWDVQTTVDSEGWSAEFRIPYSQLRFRGAAEQTWGIQFLRRVARHQETSVWAPTGRSESAIVSKMGELRGLQGIDSPRRIEVAPYTLARLERRPGNPEDPFYSRNALSSTVGADVKMGVGGGLTLDLSLNPDFGQVEADPSQVNLTAFETFLPERRPFFLEGSNLFRFGLALGDGDQAAEALFYSRRVGRAPQGSVDSSLGFAKRDANSTILGALKLSGKTPSGWSVGVMNALTSEESARIQPFDGGAQYDLVIEPLSLYTVARLSRDFRAGRSAVGVVATAVNRDGEVAEALGIRSDAYTGGADFRHRFGGDAYQITAALMATRVEGSEQAISSAQLSAARYYQRPDAPHLAYDPTRSTLSGSSALFSVGKIAGGHLRWSTGFSARSPGFEPNDVGFMNEAGFTSAFGYAGYDQSAPIGPFRRFRVNVNAWVGSSWGRERYNPGGNVNGDFQLSNFWGGYAGVNYNATALSTGLLRGGPAFLVEPNLNGWSGLYSDARRPVQLNLHFNWNVRTESDSWSVNLNPFVSWRPSGRASLSLGSSYSRNVNTRQWIRRLDANGPHYLLGGLDQTTFGLTGRVDYAFTPALSLQVYAAPFLSAGDYTDFKRVADPRAERYEDRLELLDARLDDDGRYTVALGSDGSATFRDPDFDFRQFNSNVVLRWEYRPGSALYLVWSQGRTHSGGDGRFDISDNLRGLFGVHPQNVLMLKASYWINP
jgi:hypothetical protein